MVKKNKEVPIPYPDGNKAKGINPVWHFFWIYNMRLRWAESHHLYWGLGAMAIGSWLFLASHVIAGLIIFLLGLWWALDDLDQHHRQVYEYSPLHHSLVHRLYGKIYKYKAVQWLNNLASSFFHLFAKKNN